MNLKVVALTLSVAVKNRKPKRVNLKCHKKLVKTEGEAAGLGLKLVELVVV